MIQKDSADPSCILTFPQLLQAKLDAKDGQVGSQQSPVPLVVDSPVGKGIVLERRHDVDQGEHDGRPVNHIVLGEAEKAIRVYMTEDGIVHWAGRPKQVVVDAPQCLIVDHGQLKENTEVLLYGLLEEGKGKEIQQFVLNGDGTLSPMHSSHLIWGWEPAAIKKARMDQISAFVIQHANWPAELDPSSCKANELKGGRSPLTETIYTVECSNADFTPDKVVLKRYVDSPLRNRRLVAASNVFSKVGGAPAIIAAADNWVIEPFAGQKPEFSTETRMRRIAELAALLHSVPTDWLAPLREEMCQKYPCLQNMPVGSLIWPCVAYHDGHLERYSAEEMQQLSTAISEALSMIGAEVVSTHGDLHVGNILLTADEELVSVDFEFASVSYRSGFSPRLSFNKHAWRRVCPIGNGFEQRIRHQRLWPMIRKRTSSDSGRVVDTTPARGTCTDWPRFWMAQNFQRPMTNFWNCPESGPIRPQLWLRWLLERPLHVSMATFVV